MSFRVTFRAPPDLGPVGATVICVAALLVMGFIACYGEPPRQQELLSVCKPDWSRPRDCSCPGEQEMRWDGKSGVVQCWGKR